MEKRLILQGLLLSIRKNTYHRNDSFDPFTQKGVKPKNLPNLKMTLSSARYILLHLDCFSLETLPITESLGTQEKRKSEERLMHTNCQWNCLHFFLALLIMCISCRLLCVCANGTFRKLWQQWVFSCVHCALCKLFEWENYKCFIDPVIMLGLEADKWKPWS